MLSKRLPKTRLQSSRWDSHPCPELDGAASGEEGLRTQTRDRARQYTQLGSEQGLLGQRRSRLASARMRPLRLVGGRKELACSR